jgi:hypothetical protein
VADVTGNGLRRTLEDALAETGERHLSALTVLDSQNDPFRVDTPARLATMAAELGFDGDRSGSTPRSTRPRRQCCGPRWTST